MDEMELSARRERIVGDAVTHFANPVFDRKELDRIRAAGHAAAQRVRGCSLPESPEAFERAAVRAVRMAVLDAARDALDRYLEAAEDAEDATVVQLDPSTGRGRPLDPVEVIDLRPEQLERAARRVPRRAPADMVRRRIAEALGFDTRPPAPPPFPPMTGPIGSRRGPRGAAQRPAALPAAREVTHGPPRCQAAVRVAM